MEKFSDLQKMDNKVLKEKVNLLRKESLNLRFQKNSGQLEKTARKYLKINGKWRDHMVFSLLREELIA